MEHPGGSLGRRGRGLIYWLFSRRASKELRREAGELRYYIDVMLSFLESVESAGRVSVGRDEKGRPISVRLAGSAVADGWNLIIRARVP